MRKTYWRGEIYYADLGYGIGSEQRGYRPVIIVQNNIGNRYSPTVIVAPISSKLGVKRKLPTHYLLPYVKGLQMPSVVLTEQIRTVDKQRLTSYIGRLNAIDMIKLDRVLLLSLGCNGRLLCNNKCI